MFGPQSADPASFTAATFGAASEVRRARYMPVSDQPRCHRSQDAERPGFMQRPAQRSRGDL